MSEESDDVLGLVMPFVTVSSKGGPHDDLSYTAGYEMGLMDARLDALGTWVTQAQFTIHDENLLQMDLLAMRHGFRIADTNHEFEGWIGVTLERRSS